MAIQGILELVKERLPSTIDVLGDSFSVESAIEEVKAIHDYEEIKENDLTGKEKIYIADLTALKILKAALDRYMQDAKSKGADGNLDVEYQDKLKYLKTLFDEIQKEVDLLSSKLGKTVSEKGYPPPTVIKVGAAAESGD